MQSPAEWRKGTGRRDRVESDVPLPFCSDVCLSLSLLPVVLLYRAAGKSDTVDMESISRCSLLLPVPESGAIRKPVVT